MTSFSQARAFELMSDVNIVLRSPGLPRRDQNLLSIRRKVFIIWSPSSDQYKLIQVLKPARFFILCKGLVSGIMQ